VSETSVIVVFSLYETAHTNITAVLFKWHWNHRWWEKH